MTIQNDVLFDDFGFEMNALALDIEDLESEEELQSPDGMESLEETSEDLESTENMDSTESVYEVTGELTVVNFDKFDTPLIDCSAITINLLLVLMFVALATVGGVLNE